jgi:DNA-directed RNA polymerase specialized sigma subunit
MPQEVPLGKEEPAADEIDNDLIRDVASALEDLEEIPRQIWEGRREGKTWDQLAGELKIPKQTVWRMGQEVVKLLARKLDGYRPERKHN